jgi:hypothetical protein
MRAEDYVVGGTRPFVAVELSGLDKQPYGCV